MNSENLQIPSTNTPVQLQSNDLVRNGEDILSNITDSLGIPRDILPANEDINIALSLLPRELNLISPRLRDEFIAKSCVAISVGLFDGAIVYIWNSVIKELRQQVNSFGLEMIKHISGSQKDDNFLEKMRDAELLQLCYQLNIIDEAGYFYLNQCREIRNHASIAHPTEIEIDDRELINFISRCCKYGLSDTHAIVGIDMKMFISVINSQDSDKLSLTSLAEIISETFESQKELIFDILYSKYIDTSISSHIRTNSLDLAILLKPIISNKMITSIIQKHSEIKVTKNSAYAAASRKFLESIGALKYLNDSEKIAIFKKSIKNLNNAHFALNNFYNEPPFAERLYEISTQISPIPEVVIEEYITTIFICYLGNNYGVSDNAMPFYKNMLTNLTPKGIETLLILIESLLENDTIPNYIFKKEMITKLFDYYSQSSLLNINQQNKLKNLQIKFTL